MAPDFEVGLINNQQLVDKITRKFTKKLLKTRNQNKFWTIKNIEDSVLLRRIDNLLHAHIITDKEFQNNLSYYRTLLPAYQEIVKQVKSKTESWGGRLWLVYLPSNERFFKDYKINLTSGMRDNVIQIWRDSNVDIIDLVPAINDFPNNKNDLAYHKNSHYSDIGNKFFAEKILSVISSAK